MKYVRTVDLAALNALDGRTTQSLLGADAGVQNCNIRCIKTPPDGGSPAGMHTHAVDQIFYVLQGTMNLEIAGEAGTAGPGSLVVFPAGVPHRNWNAGREATVHIAITLSDKVEAFPATGA